jgi:D-glycero-D-manno-heptose 1,7-bisphosphate phosphatase
MQDEIEIADIFVCKHGWDEGCFCRKPKPGMFFQAAGKYNINLQESYCIGDSESDMIAAKAAGVKFFLVTEKENLYSIVKKYL